MSLFPPKKKEEWLPLLSSYSLKKEEENGLRRKWTLKTIS